MALNSTTEDIGINKNNHLFNLILQFKTAKERDDFIGWYLDGGGEQVSEFYTQMHESKWTGKEPYLMLKYNPEEENNAG